MSNSFEFNMWLKSRKKSTYPKSLNSSCHINKQGNIMLLHCSGPQKLVQIVINAVTFQIESKITLITDDCANLDTTFFHARSFYVNNRVYFLQNSIPKEAHHAYCADFDLKKLFPIKNIDTKPGAFRINYSATLAGATFKIYLFGGLNENNQPTNALETFDITTYRWEKVNTTGKIPTPRHSHVAEVVRDSLYVIGGTKSNDIFDRECFLSEVFILDLNTLVWTQIALEGNVPRYLAYSYSLKVEEDSILLIWHDRANDSYEMEASMLVCSSEQPQSKQQSVQAVQHKWVSLPILSGKPEQRYQAGVCYNSATKQVVVYGGFSFTQNEMNCVSNDLDLLCLFKEEDYEYFSTLELFGGVKYEQISSSQADSNYFSKPSMQINDRYLDEDIEDISFEKLLEIEKRAEEEERMKLQSSASSSNTIDSDPSQRDNSSLASKNKQSGTTSQQQQQQQLNSSSTQSSQQATMSQSSNSQQQASKKKKKPKK